MNEVYNGKFEGEQIDALLEKVQDGSVVTENADKIAQIIEDNTLSVLDETSNKPVDSKGIASAIEAASNKLKERGYIFKGVATADTVPDNTPMSFYIGYGTDFPNFPNFDDSPKVVGLYTFEFDGGRWKYGTVSNNIVNLDTLNFALTEYVKKENLSTALSEVEARVNTRTDSEILKAKIETRQILSASEHAIYEELDKKANNNEYYPKMSVGFADNLVGRGEATPEEFNFRASAGHQSIEDDVARVKRIKGNSLVWNNQVTTHEVTLQSINDIEDSGEIKLQHLISNRVYFIALTTTNTNNASSNHPADYNIMFYSHESLEGGSIGVGISVNVNSYMFNKGTNTITNIFTCSKPFSRIRYDRKKDDGVSSKMSAIIVDLTQMFGGGNEPTTVDEFYARMPSGVDIKAYNAGEIISCNAEAINTVGFNQWDEQWVIEGEHICSENLISVLPNTDYYVKGDFANGIFWYDQYKKLIRIIYPTNVVVKSPVTARFMKFHLGKSYGTTYKDDICINLSHTGIKNGTYKPYTPFIRDISVIRRYFPNGMRSAGEVYDEISFDSSKQKWVAIQRIESVDLGSVAWTYSSNDTFLSDGLFSKPIAPLKSWTSKSNILCVKYDTASQDAVFNVKKDKTIASWEVSVRIVDFAYTDPILFRESLKGVMLYYELAEPIVTEIDEELNLDYYVEDFGTERAVSSVASTPFRADIVYTFNAVDSIRNNRLRIEELSAKMEQLMSAVSAMAASNEEVK